MGLVRLNTLGQGSERRSWRFYSGELGVFPATILDRDGTGADGHGRPSGIAPKYVTIGRVQFGCGNTNLATATNSVITSWTNAEFQLTMNTSGAGQNVILAFTGAGEVDLRKGAGVGQLTESGTADRGDIQLVMSEALTAGVHLLIEIIFKD